MDFVSILTRIGVYGADTGQGGDGILRGCPQVPYNLFSQSAIRMFSSFTTVATQFLALQALQAAASQKSLQRAVLRGLQQKLVQILSLIH